MFDRDAEVFLEERSDSIEVGAFEHCLKLEPDLAGADATCLEVAHERRRDGKEKGTSSTAGPFLSSFPSYPTFQLCFNAFSIMPLIL
ncbi:hypothetical protein CLOP_g1954 [Closterium sp. NIES-67]|nr:hypothetical protein CLOP_g1954 [Closterium sp. NIES-67]